MARLNMVAASIRVVGFETIRLLNRELPYVQKIESALSMIPGPERNKLGPRCMAFVFITFLEKAKITAATVDSMTCDHHEKNDTRRSVLLTSKISGSTRTTSISSSLVVSRESCEKR